MVRPIAQFPATSAGRHGRQWVRKETGAAPRCSPCSRARRKKSSTGSAKENAELRLASAILKDTSVHFP